MTRLAEYIDITSKDIIILKIYLFILEVTKIYDVEWKERLKIRHYHSKAQFADCAQYKVTKSAHYHILQTILISSFEARFLEIYTLAYYLRLHNNVHRIAAPQKNSVAMNLADFQYEGFVF